MNANTLQHTRCLLDRNSYRKFSSADDLARVVGVEKVRADNRHAVKHVCVAHNFRVELFGGSVRTAVFVFVDSHRRNSATAFPLSIQTQRIGTLGGARPKNMRGEKRPPRF